MQTYPITNVVELPGENEPFIGKEMYSPILNTYMIFDLMKDFSYETNFEIIKEVARVENKPVEEV